MASDADAEHQPSRQRRCQQCQRLNLESITAEGYVLHDYAEDLIRISQETGEKACDLCSLIRASLPNSIGAHRSIILYRNPPKDGPIQRIDIIVAEYFKRRDLQWCFNPAGFWRVGPPDEKPWIQRGFIEVYAPSGHTLFKSSLLSLEWRLANERSGSETCFSLATEWLSDCLSHHGSTCGASFCPELPTRLIDLGKPDGSEPPRLVSTIKGMSAAYVALSYCWGRDPFVTLTRSNEESLRESLPLELLPRTIRDAIAITRRFKVRYLWVDSLCIIQGRDEESLKDWAHESQRMNTVYRGALLTIMATGASSANDGIFATRNSPKDTYVELPLGSKDDQDVVYLGDTPVGALHANEPLHKRGWTYQEEFLSIRAISYGRDEMSWSCRRYSCRERQVAVTTQPLSTLSEGKHDPAAIRSDWTTIVSKYSTRELTYLSDKLPAIAGLAELGQINSQVRYVGGIWDSEHLAQQLLWRHHGRLVNMKHVQTRQAEYRAPTWSWASADGTVTFFEGASLVDVPWLSFESISEDGDIALSACIKHMPTVRLSLDERQWGGFHNYSPWTDYPQTMRLFLDDLAEIPDANRKVVPGERQELLNLVFLWLGSDCGLILLEDFPETRCKNIPWRRRKRLSLALQQRLGSAPGWSTARNLTSPVLGRRSFVRLGAFDHYPRDEGTFTRNLTLL